MVLGTLIEAGHRRADDDAHPRELEHVLEVNVVERRFTRRKEQLPPLLQHHVGGAVDEVVAQAMRDDASVRMLHGTIAIPIVRTNRSKWPRPDR